MFLLIPFFHLRQCYVFRGPSVAQSGRGLHSVKPTVQAIVDPMALTKQIGGMRDILAALLMLRLCQYAFGPQTNS